MTVINDLPIAVDDNINSKTHGLIDLFYRSHELSVDKLKTIPGSARLINIMQRCMEYAVSHGIPSHKSEMYRYLSRNKNWLGMLDFFEKEVVTPKVELYDCTISAAKIDVAIDDNDYGVEIPNGVRLIPLWDALSDPSIAEVLFSKLELAFDNMLQESSAEPYAVPFFSLLNAASWQHGYVLLLEESLSPDIFLQLKNKFAALPFSPFLNVVILRSGVEANVFWHSENNCSNTEADLKTSLLGVCNVIVCESQAKLQYYDCAAWHANSFIYTHTTTEVGANSKVDLYPVHKGAAIAHQLYFSNLYGEGGCLSLAAVSAPSSFMQHNELRHRIKHLNSKTVSRHCYRGIVACASCSVSQGDVQVTPGIGEVNSDQSAAYLLADSKSRAISLPSLTIDSEDVKCSHGATVGAIDAAALFYLQARGISLAQSRFILSRSFLSEVTDEYKLSVIKQYVNDNFLTDGAGGYDV